MYVVVVQKFTFAISSPDEFLLSLVVNLKVKMSTSLLIFHRIGLPTVRAVMVLSLTF